MWNNLSNIVLQNAMQNSEVAMETKDDFYTYL